MKIRLISIDFLPLAKAKRLFMFDAN